jgi:hypothetical protein
MSTFKSMKTLMLAAAAALTIGAGTAMADGNGVAGADYWAAKQQAEARQAANAGGMVTPAPNSTVQYGSSEYERPAHSAFDSPMVPGGF